jgi:hypothetical protein
MAAMKAKFILSVLGGSMLLGAASLSAQIIYPGPNTNSLPTGQSLKYPATLENDRDLGEQALFPPGLREKLQLTEPRRGARQTRRDADEHEPPRPAASVPPRRVDARAENRTENRKHKRRRGHRRVRVGAEIIPGRTEEVIAAAGKKS